MDATEIDLAIADLDERLEKLRVLYDQYFSGIERFEPMRRREELERKIHMLRREHIRNTGQRFRFQQILQRYTTFSQYWTRILREIEKGTFKRDLARAAKRFGIAPIKKGGEVVFSLEQPFEEDLRSRPEEAYEELDSSWIEEYEDEEDTAPFRRPDFGPLETSRPPSTPLSTPLPSTPIPSPMSAPTTAPPVAASVLAPSPALARRVAAMRLELEDDDLLGGAAPIRPLPHLPPSPPAGLSAVSAARSPSDLTLPSSNPAASSTSASAAGSTSALRSASAAPRHESALRAELVNRPEPVVRPAAARVPLPAPHFAGEDLNETKLRNIYDRYVEAKRKCNESTASITYEGLVRSLRESVPKLQQKHGGRVVDFEVVIKDGRTVLKPVVKGA
ncbi:MAG: MXAN_5187 C-terminal domain-containing protein [Myxococcales bacterium]|nr:hypothetical protein [Polyangiaceae bacterium]MDW8248837.1 MXAN_5187 C-terminal domain-containing protein [Myxococcales bacterium]